MSYIVGLREQTENFLLSLGFGFCIGILYDVVRTIRLLFSNSKNAILIADILYAVFAAFATFLFMLTTTNGKLMAYIVLGEGLGFFIYYFTFGVFVVETSDKIVKAVHFTTRKVFQSILFPFRWIFLKLKRICMKIREKTRKKATKVVKKSKRDLKLYRGLMYNQDNHNCKTGKKRKGVEELNQKSHAKTKKTARPKKRKFSFILTLGLIVVAGYFVISLVQAQLGIREREAKAEEVSLQYEQQVAENERLQAVVDGGDEAAYKERVAREKLGYVMPNEKVYYDITPGN